MSRVFFLVFVFSLFYQNVKAQDRFYSTRNYTVINGLPQSQVTSLVEDKSGYLWIGTHGGGLARFDGREFKVYTTLDGLLTNQIVSIHLDAHNNLWILHARGVTKFNGREFKKIEAPTTAPSSAKSMWRMFNMHDTLYVLSARDRISKLYGDSIYYWEKPLPNTLKRMHIGPNGEACFFMDDNSFFVKLPNQTISFKPDVPLEGVFNFFNYKNDILFRSKNGVFKLDIAQKKVIKMPWTTSNFVLFYDEKDDVLWTSNAKGLLREKFKPGHFDSDTILQDIEVSQILRDSEGNTWIATNGDGLYKYFLQDFQRFNAENIRGVMTMAKDVDGALWAGTMYKGLWKIKDGKATSYVDEKEMYRNQFGCVKVSPEGEVWVGTAYGLGQYIREKDSFRWYTAADGFSNRPVMCIEFDETGLWIASGPELTFFNGKSFKTYNEKDGLDAGRIVTLYYYKPLKTLYVATSSRLFAFRDGVFTPIHIPELGNACVLGLQPYKKDLLVMATTGGGVVIYNPNSKKSKLITTREGLPSDFIYFAGVDDKDYLWIGSEKGINKLQLDNKFEIVENLHFNDDNGLTGVETNQNAFYLSPKEKYFGLVDGLYEFNHAMDKDHTSFDLHLSDVQILYGEYATHEYADSTFGFFRIPYKPLLPPDRNHLTFHFNRVDKRYSKSVKYKYLLENFDTKWSQPSSVNSVTYSNLPPGNYVFRVMVTNNKGSWDDSKIAYPFTIKAPFYQTTSFIVATIILLAGIFTLIFYLRVKQRIERAMVLERIRQREQEAVRKEIARDFHDEMGNQLTRIINYISLLKLNGQGHVNGHVNGNGNGKSNAELYTKVEDSAKYLYSGTRDFIWSIDPVNDELSKLFLHIRDFGEKLFEEKNISFRAFNEIKDPVKLPYGFCRQANLIFKEVMTNAFKYSQALNVTLSLKRDDADGFEMSFEDDGIGFYTGEIQKSNGLQNIRERADRINAYLRIQSEKNCGTKIFLSFKPTKTLKYGVTI
ncbi:sensor histidine kinase [Chryseolinea sp. H1M3-3]|uniref:ligand-binding sensor domain-containing protein n=1 Tax=Chryseolinea sp. H1M3-3 TaxID=3034144 RepID=UPI0023EAB61F|nr:sensor histidine kinase [Chryseolinea sp. H1M3-3]